MSAYFEENKGLCVWFTGLPCAGKTTISKRLYEVLVRENFKVRLFDGDEVRKTISKDLGFSREDRRENVLRVAKIAKDLVDQGYIVICALVSPYRKDREEVRKMFEEGEFMEVFVDTSIEVCEKRDTRGLYKKARLGLIKNFTGIDDPYEVPDKPDVHLKTEKESIEECVDRVLRRIRQK